MRDIMMLLHETAGLMRRRFEQAARPEELTLMQWRALGLLERNGPMRQVEIKEALEASPMTISDLAERMQSAGLVVRQTDPHEDTDADRSGSRQIRNHASDQRSGL